MCDTQEPSLEDQCLFVAWFSLGLRGIFLAAGVTSLIPSCLLAFYMCLTEHVFHVSAFNFNSNQHILSFMVYKVYFGLFQKPSPLSSYSNLLFFLVLEDFLHIKSSRYLEFIFVWYKARI